MVKNDCGECKECIKYGSCKPGESEFEAKKDDPKKYCPYCHKRLKRPWSKPFSNEYTEIALECINPDCNHHGIVGYIERSEKVRLKTA